MTIIRVEYTDYWDEWCVGFITEELASLKDKENPGGLLPIQFNKVEVHRYLDGDHVSYDYKILFESNDLAESYSSGHALITDYIKSMNQPEEIINIPDSVVIGILKVKIIKRIIDWFRNFGELKLNGSPKSSSIDRLNNQPGIKGGKGPDGPIGICGNFVECKHCSIKNEPK